MNLIKLQEKFTTSEIEWRIARAGKTANGKQWAMCFAYVTARAVQDRLDNVCGPHAWKVDYFHVQPGGVLCNLSIKIGDEWVTKQDGADESLTEPFKGGISGALKRAAVVWGIGRYLYDLEESFAVILDGRKDGAKHHKDKLGNDFFWDPPKLPAWALPESSQKPNMGAVYANQPSHEDGHRPTEYRITCGQYAKRSLEEVGVEKLIQHREHLIGLEAVTDQQHSLLFKIDEFLNKKGFPYVSKPKTTDNATNSKSNASSTLGPHGSTQSPANGNEAHAKNVVHSTTTGGKTNEDKKEATKEKETKGLLTKAPPTTASIKAFIDKNWKSTMYSKAVYDKVMAGLVILKEREKIAYKPQPMLAEQPAQPENGKLL